MHIAWTLPAWAWPLLGGAALILAAWVARQYRRADPLPPARARRWLTGLRVAALCLLLLALAGPAVLRTSRQTRPPEAVVVIDDSASMTLADGPAGQTRWARALRLAAAADSLLRARVPDARVRVRRGTGLVPSRELRPGDAEPPAGVGTDLAALVRDAAAGGGDEPPQGIILLTDGHDTATPAGPPAPAAGRPAGSATFLAVGVGDPLGPPDLLVQDLRYPETAYEGEDALVEVTVGRRGTGGGGGEVAVRLRQGEHVVAEAAVPVPAGDGVSNLELALRPAAPGLQVYELEVAPLDNERYLANNRATLAIDVRKERARLLLLAGRPGWDVRFLAQGAAAAGRLRLQVVRPGPGGLVLADSGRAWTPPRDAAGWRAWEGVVVTGWDGLGAGVPWASLAGAVRAGLGLLVLAEAEPGAGSRGGPPGPLADLLPVDLAGAAWRDGEWTARAAPGAAAHPLLAGVVGDLPPGAALDSGRLPPLQELLAARSRPGAQVLLVAAPLRSAAGPGGDGPLLVTSRAGAGRVTWFGGRRLWRLAFWQPPAVSADLPHPGRRLISNLLVWTASGDEGAGLRLAGGRQVFGEGERIPLEARWDGGPAEVRLGARPLSAVLRGLDGPEAGRERAFTLAPVPGDSVRARATLPPLPAGRYEVTPTAGGQPPLTGPARAFVVAPHALEAAQTRQERRALRAFAAAVGGGYVDGQAPEAPGRLAEALARWQLSADARTVRGRWDLLAGWPLLLMATALLGAEWALRRFNGLL